MKIALTKNMTPWVVISVLFFSIIGVSLTEVKAQGGAARNGTLQKAQLKIEGMHDKTLLPKVEAALLSIPGVKTVEFRIKKKWFFLKDYNEIKTFVEFQLGTLTSETLILAVESASDAKHIYKVKFIE